MTLEEFLAIVCVILTVFCGIGYLYFRENIYVNRCKYYVRYKGQRTPRKR